MARLDLSPHDCRRSTDARRIRAGETVDHSREPSRGYKDRSLISWLSEIEVTALAMHALQLYAPAADRAAYQEPVQADVGRGHHEQIQRGAAVGYPESVVTLPLPSVPSEVGLPAGVLRSPIRWLFSSAGPVSMYFRANSRRFLPSPRLPLSGPRLA
jgi:hypothetical protein